MKKKPFSRDCFILLSGIIIIIVTLFILAPLVFLIVKGAGFMGVAVGSNEVLTSVRLSCITSLLSTVICLIFSLPIAFALTKYDFPFKKILCAMIFSPMAIPHLVAGIALLMLLGKSGLGGFLSKLGLDFVFTVQGIIAAQVFVCLPYMIKILKTAFENVDSKMEFIARTLGCSSVKSFFHVTLPLAKNGIMASAIMTWSKALGEFGAVLMIAGATRFKTELLPTAIFLNVSTGDLGLALSTATILIIISLLSMLLFEILGKGSKEF